MDSDDIIVEEEFIEADIVDGPERLASSSHRRTCSTIRQHLRVQRLAREARRSRATWLGLLRSEWRGATTVEGSPFHRNEVTGPNRGVPPHGRHSARTKRR